MADEPDLPADPVLFTVAMLPQQPRPVTLADIIRVASSLGYQPDQLEVDFRCGDDFMGCESSIVLLSAADPVPPLAGAELYRAVMHDLVEGLVGRDAESRNVILKGILSAADLLGEHAPAPVLEEPAELEPATPPTPPDPEVIPPPASSAWKAEHQDRQDRSGRRFAAEVKTAAVVRAGEVGLSAAAGEVGCSVYTLRDWIAQARAGVLNGAKGRQQCRFCTLRPMTKAALLTHMDRAHPEARVFEPELAPPSVPAQASGQDGASDSGASDEDEEQEPEAPPEAPPPPTSGNVEYGPSDEEPKTLVVVEPDNELPPADAVCGPCGRGRCRFCVRSDCECERPRHYSESTMARTG